jgi:hypothetical protein
MISNRHYSLALAKSTARCLTMLALCCLQGCLSPMALDRAVIECDKTTTDILSKLILLNIARSHQHQPMHFTGENGSLMTPVFGGTVSENPTISIVPIEGEEFTRRLLTPFQENKLTMLLRQGADADLILRLLAGELRINCGKQQGIYYNKPSDAKGYRMFRQAVLHMSSIQDRNELFVDPLMFEQHWTLPAESLTAKQMAALQKDFKIDYQAQSKQVTLSKRVAGRIVLTNYDPVTLSNSDRIRLYALCPS